MAWLQKGCYLACNRAEQLWLPYMGGEEALYHTAAAILLSAT